MRVCIAAAGLGSRLGALTAYLNKALVDVDGKPALSRIIDMFPADTEFVIALGYKGNLIREFISIAYPERVFYFAEVNPFAGAGSGLGYSLLQCLPWLRQPFIFISCDTIVLNQIPEINANWLGVAHKENLTGYRTVICKNNKVAAILEKGEECPKSLAYIGLAAIKDYETFWRGMRDPKSIEQGEVCGLREILKCGGEIACHHFTWLDTGTPSGLDEARKAFVKESDPVILPKPDENIWFVNGKVIKFSAKEDFIRQRVERAGRLKNFVPQITDATQNMYAYNLVEGEILSRIVNPVLFKSLLKFCQDFWQPAVLTSEESSEFQRRCMVFYKDKTFERINKFYATFQKKDEPCSINGQEQPTLCEILMAIDWNYLANGLPGRFHGDFHFENILWNEREGKFIFLDWRQNFGGDLNIGDIYYDFAKLLHGLIINHGLIARDFFKVKWQGGKITYDFLRRQKLVICEHIFMEWLKLNNYDTCKTRLLTALIYLNIAALHHYPYSLLLYALGKNMLFNLLKDRGSI